MKTIQHPSSVLLLCLWIGLAQGFAQTNPTPTLNDTRSGKVVAAPDPPLASDSLTPVVRPKIQERPDLTPEVQDRLQRFRREAKAYLDKEQELKKRLQGANDQERARLRAQLEELRQKNLERVRELREELRTRGDELRDKLRDHADVINSATKDKARDAHSNRDRRGD